MEELELRGRSGMLTSSDGGACRNFTVEDLIGADFRMHYTDDLDTILRVVSSDTTANSDLTEDSEMKRLAWNRSLAVFVCGSGALIGLRRRRR
jgi:hypothetical protein